MGNGSLSRVAGYIKSSLGFRRSIRMTRACVAGKE